jgi:hypothetical protein
MDDRMGKQGSRRSSAACDSRSGPRPAKTTQQPFEIYRGFALLIKRVAVPAVVVRHLRVRHRCRNTLPDVSKDLPPCLAMVFWMLFEPDRHTSCLPASPKSTTCGSLGMPSCGVAAFIAAFNVDLNSSSVSPHGIVVSFSACTNTSCRREQRSSPRSA